MYRIAVVEDDSMMQKVLKAMFEAQDCEVRIWGDGGSALRELPDQKPDLVILDVNLPDMTGHDVCRTLKADPRTSQLPVLMLTGEAREVENRVSALELGADDYLFKPISPRILVARVTSILRAKGRASR